MPETATECIFRLITLDPVHIGVGQNLMGEVDLPIDREPETQVPRFPGSSLKGAFRANADWKLRIKGVKTAHCLGEKPRQDSNEEGGSALHGESTQSPIFQRHCGVGKCPICQSFGWPPEKNQGITGHEGRIFFRDARLAFFPAATDCGTFWFSTPGRAAGYLDLDISALEGAAWTGGRPELLFGMSDGTCLCTREGISELRAGWLHIADIKTNTEDEKIKEVYNALLSAEAFFPGGGFWQCVSGRTVLLDETAFYRLVESCLERRTCNRINEDTGTVENKALFSYEAIPRHSLLYSRLSWHAWDNPVGGYQGPLAVCELAREGFYRMGIGGLQTRGLGSVLVEPLHEPITS